MEDVLADLEKQIEDVKAAIQAKKAKEEELAKQLHKFHSGYIKLNVGGVEYTTSCGTLARYPSSMLESLVSGRFEVKRLEDGSVFIDRDGRLFGIILNALRTGTLSVPPGFQDFEALAREIEFYQLPFKVPRARGAWADFSRADFCHLLAESKPRPRFFVGMRFCGLDLSGLRFIGHNKLAPNPNGFSVCFSGCDFSGCTLEGSRFEEVDLTNCSFQHADLTSCIFITCDLSRSDFTKAVLKKATLRKCVLVEAKLIRANLTEAECMESNFTKCNFHSAKLQRTNLTNANLSNTIMSETDTSTANCTGVQGVILKK